MAKHKKIDKYFPFSDSTVNCYGFRLLTSGYIKEEFEKNPIGYYMHDRDNGVVVRWADLKIEGDQILAKPIVNLSNVRGQQTVDEIESGFLNGASVGHIVALEYSEDPKDMLPGQSGPTITKWFNRELSVVDIPGNYNSIALFDKEGNMINLSDFKIQNKNMKQIILTAPQLTKLNLSVDSDATAVDSAIDALLEVKSNAHKLAGQVAQLSTDLTAAQNELVAFKKSTSEKQVADLLSKAVADSKITVELSGKYKTLFADKPEELKDLLEATPAYSPVTPTLGADTASELDELRKLSGEQLWKTGKLERLKELSADVYAIKYKEAFGADPVKE